MINVSFQDERYIYVIELHTGSWDSAWWNVSGIFHDEIEAEYWAASLEVWFEDIRKNNPAPVVREDPEFYSDDHERFWDWKRALTIEEQEANDNIKILLRRYPLETLLLDPFEEMPAKQFGV